MKIQYGTRNGEGCNFCKVAHFQNRYAKLYEEKFHLIKYNELENGKDCIMHVMVQKLSLLILLIDSQYSYRPSIAIISQ
uniref:Uncharacterized protein n=1 Tax=Romanomermis culicivorax TaxID=13658 RepID=A0A915KB28_ROMCU